MAVPASIRHRHHASRPSTAAWLPARLQQVASEVALEVAPDAVDVGAAVTGVVELEEERRSLEPVVVGHAWSRAARPAETRARDARALDAREGRARHRPGMVREVR